MYQKSIAVYAGSGSSHSWTWLVDMFEATGIHPVRFLDAKGFKKAVAHEAATAIVSGGDGFRIASSIGPPGFARLTRFLRRGGKYVGICAGAYLPLPSSLEPFRKFNVSSTKIENIERTSPSCDPCSPRLAVRYGNCSIVHPVRGEVELESNGKRLRAPIYGGPVFSEPGTDEVLMRYSGFTSQTEFQFDQRRAAAMMLGRPAAIRTAFEGGELILLGPHLEHPRYPEGNLALLELMGFETRKRSVSRPARADGDELDDDLHAAMADLKVMVLGLEGHSFLVGAKLWDGARYMELLRAIERRAWTLEGREAREVTALLDAMAELLMYIADRPELLESDVGPELLVEAARICADSHFRMLARSR